MIERFLPRVDFESYEDFKANYKVNVPDGFNFAYDVMDQWAIEEPDSNALYWCNENNEEKMFTFSDIKRITDKTANYFSSLGIGKDDTVMLILKQRPEVWFSILALHKIGAVVIPATFQLTTKDIVYRCDMASIKMIVCVDEKNVLDNVLPSVELASTLKMVGVVGSNIPEGCLDFKNGVENASDHWERIPNQITDRMLIYFSSGTTGMPKMILHDFSYPLGHIVTAKYWQHVQKGKLHLTAADSGWAKFGWGKIYGQWICGAVIVAYDTTGKFNAHHMLETIERIKLTTFCAPPTVFRFLIKEDLSKYDLSCIEHTSIAGEPLNEEVYNKFYELTGLHLTEGFGQSESSVLIANFEWFDVKPGSMGKPSPLYDIDIVDADGNSCEDGIVGSVVVHLDRQYPVGLFKEYYKDKEANEKAFVNNWYDTGDTAWRDSDGYLWFNGRSDDVIKCSGYRIGPFEVENAIMTHPSVLECAVTAAPDPTRGQVVKATIVLAKGFCASDELKKEIQDHVKHVTAPYKYPRIVEFVDSLPKTTSGKIMRSEIRRIDEK